MEIRLFDVPHVNRYAGHTGPSPLPLPSPTRPMHPHTPRIPSGLAASPEASGGVLVICGLVVPLRAGDPVARLVGQALHMEVRQAQEDVYLRRLHDAMPDLEGELLEARGAAPRINPRIFPSRPGGGGAGLEEVPDPDAPRQLALTGPKLGGGARRAAALTYWKVRGEAQTETPTVLHWVVADVLTRVRLVDPRGNGGGREWSVRNWVGSWHTEAYLVSAERMFRWVRRPLGGVPARLGQDEGIRGAVCQDPWTRTPHVQQHQQPGGLVARAGGAAA